MLLLLLSLHMRTSCTAQCWQALCVIGPCSHLKCKWWFSSKVQCCCKTSFLLFIFFSTLSVSSLMRFNWSDRLFGPSWFDSFFAVNLTRIRSSEKAEFNVFVPAAESTWRDRVSEASAPAGYCACGSVPHAPHWWVSCNGQDCFLKWIYFTQNHSHCFSLITPADYLNNLSPDSKEYEDTQGTINKQQRVDTALVTGEPYWPVLVALCLLGIYLLSFGVER